MGQASSPKKELGLELTNMKRNPYLVDYSQFQKKRRERDFAKAAARKKRARMLFYRRLAVVTAAFVVLIAAVILAVWALSRAGGTEASLGNAITGVISCGSGPWPQAASSPLHNQLDANLIVLIRC